MGRGGRSGGMVCWRRVVRSVLKEAKGREGGKGKGELRRRKEKEKQAEGTNDQRACRQPLGRGKGRLLRS